MMMINVGGDEDYDTEPMRGSRYYYHHHYYFSSYYCCIFFPITFIILITMMMMLAEMKSMIRNQCAGLAMARAQ